MRTKIFTDYQETLDYFFHSRPHGTIKLGLSRIERLLELLGNPQTKFNALQIAGTNGKGSVTRLLSTIFTELSYKTGANYSPHLIRFNERITFNNHLITNEEIVSLANDIFEAVNSMDQISEEMKPSFFECTTAMAFKYFEKKSCDIAAVEVGLGGRLDATTSLNPVITAITSIGLDHVKTLGDTIEKIAYEKAGIIKDQTPVICGTEKPEAVSVIKAVANQRKAPFYQFSKDYHFEIVKSNIDNNVFDFYSKKKDIKNINIRMNGIHQMKNASTAIMAYLAYCEQKGSEYSSEALKRAIQIANWPGRFEKLSDNPLIIVDGAHNVEGIDSLVENWKLYFGDIKPILLTGMLSGKDYTHIVKTLADMTESVIITEPNSPRDTDTSIIVNEYKKQKKEIDVNYIPDHQSACMKSLELSKQKNLPVLITGSLYVIGYLKEIITFLH
ncbi:MAG: bifunctional folylpolyglutamate synthase/dihydrofolate synthase [bacterium]